MVVVMKPICGFCDNENALSEPILRAGEALMHPKSKCIPACSIRHYGGTL